MNERRKHKYWKNVMIISFILSLLCCPARTFAEEAEFSGSRICAARIDSSDLENYIDGGRKGLDFVIRKIRPDWLSVDISMSEHDVIVTLKYDFASYQEYRNRTRQMQMHEPLGGYNEEILFLRHRQKLYSIIMKI